MTDDMMHPYGALAVMLFFLACVVFGIAEAVLKLCAAARPRRKR